ncbi:hypothetical protein CALCODRAFT_488999 [Calocera cornea HHB12733]|uniref:Uncharacterized protein n=1 Tax=Calocera cornea HHB12733 TaxID=1353952 RepID=A0A165C0D3_9BASI|nr:hypothetical protein CALCODRAFT_488999 [Calocera cornea HHB12733]
MAILELWSEERHSLPHVFGDPAPEQPYWIAEFYDEAMRDTDKGEELYKALASNTREVGKAASIKNLWDNAWEIKMSEKSEPKKQAEIRANFNTHSLAFRAFLTTPFDTVFHRLFQIPAFEDLSVTAVNAIADSDFADFWAYVLEQQCDLLEPENLEFKVGQGGQRTNMNYPDIADANFWRYVDNAAYNYDIMANKATQRPVFSRSTLKFSGPPKYSAFLQEALSVLYNEDGAPHLWTGDDPLTFSTVPQQGQANTPVQTALATPKASRGKGKGTVLLKLPATHYLVAKEFKDRIATAFSDDALILLGPSSLQHFVSYYEERYRDVIGLFAQAAFESHPITGPGGNRSVVQKRSPSAFRCIVLSQFDPAQGEPSKEEYDECMREVIGNFSPISKAALLDELTRVAHFAMTVSLKEIQDAPSDFLQRGGEELTEEGVEMAQYLAWWYASKRPTPPENLKKPSKEPTQWSKYLPVFERIRPWAATTAEDMSNARSRTKEFLLKFFNHTAKFAVLVSTLCRHRKWYDHLLYIQESFAVPDAHLLHVPLTFDEDDELIIPDNFKATASIRKAYKDYLNPKKKKKGAPVTRLDSNTEASKSNKGKAREDAPTSLKPPSSVQKPPVPRKHLAIYKQLCEALKKRFVDHVACALPPGTPRQELTEAVSPLLEAAAAAQVLHDGSAGVTTIIPEEPANRPATVKAQKRKRSSEDASQVAEDSEDEAAVQEEEQPPAVRRRKSVPAPAGTSSGTAAETSKAPKAKAKTPTRKAKAK